MEETLVCESCQKSWSRQRSRGRKPRYCSECLNSEHTLSSAPVATPPNKESANFKNEYSTLIHKVYSTLLPKNPKADSLLESTKNGSKWKCPSCGHILTIHLAITDIPTHRCTPSTVTVKRYERID